MAFPHRRALSVVLTALLLGVQGGAAYYARRVILLFIFAIFFAYVVFPAVRTDFAKAQGGDASGMMTL